MKKETARVFVVDDDPSVCRALDRLIRSGGLLVETFASADAFLEHPGTKGPSCLILDIKMPGITGMELQEKLLSKGNTMPIIFITGHGDIPLAVEAIKKGAIDFLSKPFNDEDLFDAIDEALVKSRKMLTRLADQAAIRCRLDSLTKRESEILTYVITGMLNKQIAAALNISEATVKVHRGRVMEKMNVASVAKLVQLAQKVDIKPAKIHP
ncbi:MAG: DNA-binding response regulator [Deltaproteobacteria bacterium]|nr:MAG: DNA-binding response regulator [Deltaproteobacteria bacterium]